MTGWPTDQVYMELKNQLESIGGVMVIILDEIDKLVKKSGDDTLYNLTRINSDLKFAKVSIIGISNDLRFTDFLDPPRVLSSLSEEEIVFPPLQRPPAALRHPPAEGGYGVRRRRARRDGHPALCGARGPGARRRTAALDLLRVSGELADRENAAGVTEKHVRMAQEKIETDSMVECISTLPTQSKAVLYAMLILEQMGKRIFTSGEVTVVYREIARIIDLDVLTHRRITDLISELNMLGVINTRVISRGGRYGRTKEMWFDATTSKIEEVVTRDPRLDDERLKKLDINRLRAMFR